MPTIRELVEEAEENYVTGRYDNSRELFKRAAIETFDQGILPDALYLTYRSVLDMSQTDTSDLSQMRFIKQIISQLSKSIVQNGKKLLEDDDISRDDRIELLQHQAYGLSVIDRTEDEAIVIQSLIAELQKAYTETIENDGNVERYLTTILQYEPNNTDTLGKLLDFIYSKATYECEHGQFDGDLVAASLLIQVLQYVNNSIRDQISPQLDQYAELINNIIEGKYAQLSRVDDIRQLLQRYNQEWFGTYLKMK